MKKIYLITSFLIVFNICFTQTIVVEYEKNTILPPPILKQLSFDDIEKINSRPLRKSYLYHKDGKSSYRIESDTLISTKFKEDVGNIPMYERAVFKDLFEETLTYIDMLNDSTTAAIEQIVHSEDWHETGETKEILGYKCHNTQKRNKYGIMQNVWYTNDISIFDGPEDICGFSGLVLEYERGGKTLKAVKIKQDKDEKYPLLPPKIKNIISYTEFENRLKGRMKF